MELRKYELRSSTHFNGLACIYDSIDGDEFEDGVEWCRSDDVDTALAAKDQRIAELEASENEMRELAATQTGRIVSLNMRIAELEDGNRQLQEESDRYFLRVQQLEAEQVSEAYLYDARDAFDELCTEESDMYWRLSEYTDSILDLRQKNREADHAND